MHVRNIWKWTSSKVVHTHTFTHTHSHTHSYTIKGCSHIRFHVHTFIYTRSTCHVHMYVENTWPRTPLRSVWPHTSTHTTSYIQEALHVYEKHLSYSYICEAPVWHIHAMRCTKMYIYTFIYIYTHEYMHVFIQGYAKHLSDTYIYMRSTYTYTQVILRCVRTCVYIYIWMYTYIYINVRMHSYIWEATKSKQP